MRFPVEYNLRSQIWSAPHIVQAPHVHFLLMEACDILGIHPLPLLHVTPAPTPFAHLLRIPSAHLAESLQTPRGSVHARFSWRRQALLVVSSAAMAGCSAGELQAVLAGALAPMCAPGGCL